jgi:hypothetical protein
VHSRILVIAGVAIVVSACAGVQTFAPTGGSSAQASFQLAPASIDLSPASPSDSFNAQGDVVGVSYTPMASSSCATASGSIVVSGNGVAQTDVAGAPLLFTVNAVGTAPPSTCTVTVIGTDDSVASVVVNYDNSPVTDLPDARNRIAATPVLAPNALSFTSLASVQEVQVSGFSGTTSASVQCHLASSGVQVSPNKVTGAGTFTVIPYGQGGVANNCSIGLADAVGDHGTIAVALSIGALAKLTAAPRQMQFACAGTAAPFTCQSMQAVALAENGTHTYGIVTRPTLKGSCANVFYGPLTMTADGTTFAQSITGSAVTLTFAGLLDTAPPPSCSQIVITDNGSPAQRAKIGVVSAAAPPPPDLALATPPPCTGTDHRVADPTAPHGLYVWNPYKVDGGVYEQYIEQYVIGKNASGAAKDPNICGVSLLVEWAEVEKTKGNFDWSQVITWAQPYVKAGLTVNLLFADASEVGSNTATPSWVTDPNGDNVATISCSGQPSYPNYIDPTYESDYKAFIAAAVAEFSQPAPTGSSITASIGYMRFGLGAGVEAYPAHFSNYPNDACSQAFMALGYSFDAWVTHTRHIVNSMGSLNTNGKQLMIALNEIAGYPNSFYDYPNDGAEVAANNSVGFGTENLGIGHVADAGTSPAPCNPQGTDGSVYWCQAFNRHAGTVPFEFQPIEAVADPQPNYSISFPNLLQFALDNNTQLFEIYPQDWLEADSPTQMFPGGGGSAATWKSAFNATALIVGAQH